MLSQKRSPPDHSPGRHATRISDIAHFCTAARAVPFLAARPQRNAAALAHRATLDIPRELAQFVADLLAAERLRRGTPRGSRALTCCCRPCWACGGSVIARSLARWPRDHGTSRATAYRYLEEVIDLLAEQAPGLHQALEWGMLTAAGAPRST
jgi:hypothetical protein